MNLALLMVVAAFTFPVLLATQPAQASGDCNPTWFPVGACPVYPEFEPEVPFTVEIVPEAGEWPTTPSLYLWEYYVEGEKVRILKSEASHEFVFPPPHESEVSFFIGSTGPGVLPECPDWTGTRFITVRLKGYVEPTPTPTPEPTPCPNICEGKLIYPQHNQENLPLSFIAECASDAAILGVETSSGNHQGSLEQLAPGRYYISGLLPEIASYCRPRGGSGGHKLGTARRTPVQSQQDDQTRHRAR